MDPRLSEFMELVLDLTRDKDSLTSRVASFFGMATSQKQLNYQIRKAAVGFAEAHKTANKTVMRPAAKQVEALVLTAQTVSAITPEDGERLINKLYNLLEGKR